MPFKATNVPFQPEQRKSRQHAAQEQASGGVWGEWGAGGGGVPGDFLWDGCVEEMVNWS